MTGNIVELFSSIQGEGKYIGYRQLFLRLSGCNLACTYCDTPGSHRVPRVAKIEKMPGLEEFTLLNNPLSFEQILEGVRALLKFPHHSLSVTGGEPLTQVDFLHEILPLLHQEIPLYLETNGTLYDELGTILPWLDYISMDIKLPSAVGENFFKQHHKFIETAQKKDLFIKMVLSNQTNKSECLEAFALIADVNPAIPLILQPVTPVGPHAGLAGSELLDWQEQALKYLKDVRVIPQTQGMLKIL